MEVVNLGYIFWFSDRGSMKLVATVDGRRVERDFGRFPTCQDYFNNKKIFVNSFLFIFVAKNPISLD